MSGALLDPAYLRRLEALRLLDRRLSSGSRRRPSPSPSGGFRDRRPYVPGDDPRRLDWAALARTDRAVVRRFEDRRPGTLLLLLDASASMEGILRRALRIGLALAYLALHRRERLVLEVAGGRDGPAGTIEGGSPAAFLPAAEVLEDLRAAGSPDLAATVRRILRRGDGRGARRAAVVSDLLLPDPGRSANLLGGAGVPATFVQVLSADDLAPPWRGALALEDAETGRVREIDVDEETARRHGRAVDAFLQRSAGACLRAGAVHHLVRPGTPPHEGVRSLLERGAVG